MAISIFDYFSIAVVKRDHVDFDEHFAVLRSRLCGCCDSELVEPILSGYPSLDHFCRHISGFDIRTSAKSIGDVGDILTIYIIIMDDLEVTYQKEEE